MFVLRDTITIHAPLARCFDLSCSLRIVQRELHMHPVAGHDPASGAPYRTEGLVVGGDRVRWEGWQLGLPQLHVSLISGFERCTFLQDTMIEGRFAHFQHDHHFRQEGTDAEPRIVLDDEIRFALPFGPLGWLVGRFVMVPHIRKLLGRRFQLLKRIAETEEWRDYLPAPRVEPAAARI